MHPGWHQAWRRPLRQALDYLRDACIPLFEKEASRYLRDPWGARNDYVDIINDQSAKNVNAFLESHAARELSRGEKVRALQWLGAQACSMLMYTSCGWFFDDISGLETTQILKYAARMIQLMEDLQPGLSLEPEFVRLLSEAPSNVAENGARVYEMYVKPAQVDILRVGAHYVLSSLYLDYPEKTQKIYSYRVDDEVYERFTAGQLRLALGKLRIVTNLTWEEAELAFAAASFGDPNVAAGVSHFRDEHTFREMFDDVRSAFERADIPAIVRSIDRHFPSPYNYSLWHLFKDEQRRVLDEIMKSRYEEIATFYRSIYKSNYRLMNSLKSLGSPIPPDFLCAAERAVNMELREIFEGRFSIRRLEQLVADAGRWPLTIDTSGIGLAAISWLDNGMKRLVEEPENPESIPGMEEMKDALRVLHSLPAFQLDVWRSQNMYFRLKGRIGNLMSERARKGDEEAKRWIAAFRDLGAHLRIKVHERM